MKKKEITTLVALLILLVFETIHYWPYMHFCYVDGIVIFLYACIIALLLHWMFKK